jgi:hypothetical protein
MLSLASALLPVAALASAEIGFQGSVATRDQATFPSEESLLSTRDLPILLSQNELNLQGKASLLEDKLRFGADVSAFVFFGGLFADADASGQLKEVDDHEVPATRPFIALSEYWASLAPIENLVITVGKKRTTWGPGIAFSPTDLLNPLRDPTDPSLQRAGFLQARIDVPLEGVTLTALFAPQVLETANAIPTRVYLDRDDEPHWAAVLRAYALVGEADLNAWVLFSHRYGDAFEDRPRFAATLSQSLFLNHEFHAEVLLQQGTPRLYAEADCTESRAALARCALTGRPVLDDALLDSDRILPRILVGWRWMPDDGSMLSLEYLYQADGFLRGEYGDMMRLLGHAGSLQREGRTFSLADPTAASSASSSGEAPTRFAFQALRRHYLFLSYTKPQILDDFTLQATLITPVEDLSMLAQASITWQAREWLQLSLFGFAPLPSPARISAGLKDDPWQELYESVDPEWRGFIPRGAVIDGVPLGEYDALPFRARVMFEARAFF